MVEKQGSNNNRKISVSFLISELDLKNKEKCFEELFQNVEFAQSRGFEVDFDIMTNSSYQILKNKSSKNFVMIVNPNDTQKPWRLLMSWLATEQCSSNGAHTGQGISSYFLRNIPETDDVALFEDNSELSDLSSCSLLELRSRF